jgi:hypothetical protein
MFQERAMNRLQEESGGQTVPQEAGCNTPETNSNGKYTAGAPGGEQQETSTVSPTVKRAEELADRIAHQVSAVSGVIARKVVSMASRMREATQDFWAEVQNFRHGHRP